MTEGQTFAARQSPHSLSRRCSGVVCHLFISSDYQVSSHRHCCGFISQDGVLIKYFDTLYYYSECTEVLVRLVFNHLHKHVNIKND